MYIYIYLLCHSDFTLHIYIYTTTIPTKIPTGSRLLSIKKSTETSYVCVWKATLLGTNISLPKTLFKMFLFPVQRWEGNMSPRIYPKILKRNCALVDEIISYHP